MAAENDGPNTTFVIPIVGALIGVGVAMLVFSYSSEPSAPAVMEEPMASTGLTAERPERLPVPRGLKSLTFGSTVKETIAALPDASCDDTPFWNVLDDTADPQPPGPLWQCETTIGTQKADCDLYFSTDERLSAMACRVHTEDNEVYDAVLATIRETLTSNHGAPTRQWNHDGPLGMTRDSGWLWKDDNARLELRSTFAGITLVNSSRAHHNLLVQHRRAAAQAAEESERRQERDRQRKLDDIEKSRSAFDRDL